MRGSDAAVLVPVKAFAAAKVRLAPALDAAERADLARRMAEAVVTAANGLPVAIACDDEGVRAWAASLGAEVVWTPGTGLDGAVQRGVEVLAAGGRAKVIVAHGDLPHAAGLDRLADFPGITLVPDRHDDGTNVIVVPVSAGFRFAYGPASFRRHLAEARRCGGPVRIARIDALRWDVDTPADLPPVPAAT
jgi:2-phospho-L-lactate guanylyltransferase